ncbi:hypothetical protein B566_EDAN009537 [Ephemera danica]|nr:hypothetical protein B566_EDAN009537 [Ephemera danica]
MILTFDRDKRPKLNPKDFTVENLTDCCTSVRTPGSVAGKQFIIQNCKDAFIYVLDHCSTITVDDCSNCKIVLGPTKGSLDFIVGDVLRSDVPLTSGSRSGSNDDCCLAVILPSSQQLQHAMDFIAAMTNLDGRFELVETRERSINANEAKQFLHGIATIPASETPLQLVGLHFRGPGCVEKCQQVVAHLSLSPDCSGQMFVSPSSEVARKQIQNFMAATDHC